MARTELMFNFIKQDTRFSKGCLVQLNFVKILVILVFTWEPWVCTCISQIFGIYFQQKLVRIHSLKGQILKPFVHAVKFLMLQMDINFFLYNRDKDIHRGIKFSSKDLINNVD